MKKKKKKQKKKEKKIGSNDNLKLDRLKKDQIQHFMFYIILSCISSLIVGKKEINSDNVMIFL
jgi:hypothetical protein